MLYFNGYIAESLLAFALAGALFGFLLYNFEPAKIFMGDTGSMVVGYLLAFLAFRTMQSNDVASLAYTNSAAVMAFAVLIIPMYDTARVILIRLKNKQSPLSPDANHIHHHLLRAGYSHRGIVVVMAFANLVILTMAFILRDLNVHVILAGSVGMAVLILPVGKAIMRTLRLNERNMVLNYTPPRNGNGEHAPRTVEREHAELFQ
jgi:UDP-N-acetylmuramyl pentapeptide phosphotransferase/UDP-N-acetylglucosamine-1-phosphate transferase